MTFGLFVPSRYSSSIPGPGEDDGGKASSTKSRDCIPALYFLSGLTCDGELCFIFSFFVCVRGFSIIIVIIF